MGEQRAFSSEGVPYLYVDRHESGRWAVSILFSNDRSLSDHPYALHLSDQQSNTETVYAVKRADNTELSLDPRNHSDVPDDIEKWALGVAEVYDNILEGLTQ